MKVFISSVITGFEAFRDAATGAVKALGYDVVRAEDFPASTSSPQVAAFEASARLTLQCERESSVGLDALGIQAVLKPPRGSRR